MSFTTINPSTTAPAVAATGASCTDDGTLSKESAPQRLDPTLFDAQDHQQFELLVRLCRVYQTYAGCMSEKEQSEYHQLLVYRDYEINTKYPSPSMHTLYRRICELKQSSKVRRDRLSFPIWLALATVYSPSRLYIIESVVRTIYGDRQPCHHIYASHHPDALRELVLEPVDDDVVAKRGSKKRRTSLGGGPDDGPNKSRQSPGDLSASPNRSGSHRSDTSETKDDCRPLTPTSRSNTPSFKQMASPASKLVAMDGRPRVGKDTMTVDNSQSTPRAAAALPRRKSTTPASPLGAPIIMDTSQQGASNSTLQIQSLVRRIKQLEDRSLVHSQQNDAILQGVQSMQLTMAKMQQDSASFVSETCKTLRSVACCSRETSQSDQKSDVSSSVRSDELLSAIQSLSNRMEVLESTVDDALKALLKAYCTLGNNFDQHRYENRTAFSQLLNRQDGDSNKEK